MRFIGGAIKNMGIALWVITGLWGTFLVLAIISKAAGFWGLVAAIFVAPVTALAAPLYAGFAWHNWFPLVLIWGGSIASMALIAIGDTLRGE